MSRYPKWTHALLPYTRREFPGWGKVLRLARAESWRYDSSLWMDAPTVTLRGKTHGLLMRLDLSNWSERRTFFLGRYYELHLQLLLARLLRPGDRMLDVGANTGMITLCAAALVGENGLVESFEPNPVCVRKLREHVALNGLRQVAVHPVGLSDAPATLKLRLQTSRATPSLHSGTGTLAPVAESDEDVIVGEYDVSVVRGDDIVLASDGRPVSLVKIDVEGFELKALMGLRATLERWHPAVITEFMEEHLTRAGTSRRELRTWMESLGYVGQAVYTRRQGIRHGLVVEPMDRAESRGVPVNDVVWVHRNRPVLPAV